MPITEQEAKNLERTARKIRRDIVDVTGWAGGSHIGGSLSEVDILTILYWKYMNINPKDPNWDDRDRFVLSKGHGGVGHAVVLANKGYFDAEWLKEFNHFNAPRACTWTASRPRAWMRPRDRWDTGCRRRWVWRLARG